MNKKHDSKINTPLVSIITPTYNCEKYISESIDSVLNQLYQNWELILVDDCSNDNTYQILELYEHKDSRIHCYKLDVNVGAGESRNIGLSKVKGSFIAFLDSDDVWLPNKLSTQLEFMHRFSAAISFTGYTIMDESLRHTKSEIKVPISVNLNEYLKTTIIGMSTSMINKNVVDDFKLNKIRSRQDGILWIELLKRGHTAFGLNEQLVKYRMRKNSISSNKYKAMMKIWFIYRRYAKLSVILTGYYFFYYILNNLKRRYLNNL